MIRTYKTEALILKKVKRGEADSVITVLTRSQGLITVVARGIRKINSRRGPYLDIFNHVILYLAKGKTFDIITDVKPLANFGGLKSDLSRVACAFKVAELTSRLLPENESHDLVYNKVLKLLVKFSEKTRIDELGLMNEFGNFLLQDLGYIPQSHTLSGKDIDNKLEDIMERKIKANNLLAKLL